VKDPKQDEDWEDAIRTTRTKILPKLMKWDWEETTGSVEVQDPGAAWDAETDQEEDEAEDEDQAGVWAEDQVGNKNRTINPAMDGTN
jgi:hypothetical protein